MSASCRSCGAEIVWALTGSGQRMPLDPEAREDGNVEVTAWRNVEGEKTPVIRVLGKAEAASPRLFDGEAPARYVSHFATCPDANKHRRSR